MKKWIAILLVLALSFALFGCGKNPLVKAVEEQIDALGTVTYEDREKVSDARSAYEALLEKERKKVKNLEVLEQAEATITAIEQETRQQADEILTTQDAYDVIPQLRQLTQTAYVKSSIQTRALQLLKAYVLHNGTPCDLSGNPDETGSYLAVYPEGMDAYFIIGSDGEGYLEFEERDESPSNGMMLSDYKIHLRTRVLLFDGYSQLYSQTEHFSKGNDFFYVSWDAWVSNVSTMEELEKLPMELESSNYAHWPYDMSEEYLEENVTSDADRFIEDMNEALQSMGLPMTAWEVLGIWE